MPASFIKRYFVAAGLRGASLVEAAIALPLFLLLIIAIIEFARIFAAYLLIQFGLQRALSVASLETGFSSSITTAMWRSGNECKAFPTRFDPQNPDAVLDPTRISIWALYDGLNRTKSKARNIIEALVATDREESSLYLKQFHQFHISLSGINLDRAMTFAEHSTCQGIWIPRDGIVVLRPGDIAHYRGRDFPLENTWQEVLPTSNTTVSVKVQIVPIALHAELVARPLFLPWGALQIPVSATGWMEIGSPAGAPANLPIPPGDLPTLAPTNSPGPSSGSSASSSSAQSSSSSLVPTPIPCTFENRESCNLNGGLCPSLNDCAVCVPCQGGSN